MEKDESKWKRQEEGIVKWRHSTEYGAAYNGCGIWKWVTGMGKTYAATYIIEKVLEKNPNFKILILMTRTPLIAQWEKTLQAIDVKGEVIISTIQSFDKIKEFPYDFLIVDEIHEFYSSKRLRVIKEAVIKKKLFLGLSATPEDHQGRHEVFIEGCPVVDIISEKEAIENNWISDYFEYNLGVKFTEDEYVLYREYTDFMKDYFSNYGDFSLAMKCLMGDGFDSGWDVCCKIAASKGWKDKLDLTIPDNQIIESTFNPKVILDKSKELMSVRSKREHLCNTAEEKYNTVEVLFNKFPTRKTIIFSLSTEFATEMAKRLNKTELKTDLFTTTKEEVCVVYHSKVESAMHPSPKTGKMIKFGANRIKERALARIASGESRAISAAEALDTGTDIPNLGLGIGTSTNRSKTKQIQKGGRVKRIGQEEEKVIIVNLYCLESVEESILKEAQTNKPIWINSPRQIAQDGSFNPFIL